MGLQHTIRGFYQRCFDNRNFLFFQKPCFWVITRSETAPIHTAISDPHVAPFSDISLEHNISGRNFVIAVNADFDRYTALTISHHISIVIALAVLPLFPPFGLAGGPLLYRLLLPALFHQNQRVEYD
jgi:hypothetical protein